MTFMVLGASLHLFTYAALNEQSEDLLKTQTHCLRPEGDYPEGSV
jgi:hypothetical protein